MASTASSKSAEKQVAVPTQVGEKILEFAQKFADAMVEEQTRIDEWEQMTQEREKAWTSLAHRFDVSQLGEPVVFNVGGVKFATSIETLKKVPDTYFSNLVSGRWDVKCSKDGSIFIDRDPAVFGFLLRYLRDPENFHKIRKHLTPLERCQFAMDCEFFMMPQEALSCETPLGLQMTRESFNKLSALVGFTALRLLYQCSEDGYGPGEFHKRCDNQGPTLVIAETEDGGFIGAYTSVSWCSPVSWASDASAFLFTIKSGESVVNQFRQTANFGCAVYHHSTSGAAFGGGFDLTSV